MNERLKGAVHIQSNILFICSIQNREENSFIVCGLEKSACCNDYGNMKDKVIICLRKHMLSLALLLMG